MTDFTSFDDIENDFPQGVPEVGFVAPGGAGWYDTFTARQVTFEDGQVEICIQREKHFAGAALAALPKAKRGESTNPEASREEAGRRAKKRVRQLCKALGADRMITLTYRENMTDRVLALKHFDMFRRKMGKNRIFQYVAVIEPQDRGSLHFHIAVKGRQNYYLVRETWQNIVGLGQFGEKMGQVNVRNPHKFGFGVNGVHKLAAYIAKYCGKNMEAVRSLNQKRYFASRNISVPEVVTWRLASNTMLEAVQCAFAVVQQWNMNDLLTWCNNGLGIVWLATGPGQRKNTVPF
jgi:hypothetical protein